MTITLATLAEATAQEVFDQIVTHLRTQHAKSRKLRDDEMLCAYRSEDGLMSCAAGCLISDAEYHPNMEGKAWNHLAGGFGGVPYQHKYLILRMQRVHDEVDVFYWERRFREVALTYALTYTPTPEILRVSTEE